MSSEISKLFVTIGADTKAFEKGMKDISSSMTKTGAAMMATGTAIVGSLFAITTRAAATGDEMMKMSQRTGISTEALSELRYAADLSDTSIQDIENSIRRMQMTLGDAAEGSASAEEAINNLGFSINEIMAMAPDEQFMALTGAIAEIEDPTLRAAAATDIFGRRGTDLLPMLADGREGLEALRKEAHEYGVIIDEEAAQKSADFNDALSRMKGSMEGVVHEIGTALMPAFTEFIEERIVPAVGRIADWVSKNEDLVLSLLKVASVLAVGGAVMMALGQLARAITSINTALTVMLSLSGPKGWAVLAGAAGVAAAAFAGFRRLTPDEQVPFPTPQTHDIFGEPYRTGGGVETSWKPAETLEPEPKTSVNVMVEGSVMSEKELVDTIHEGLLVKESTSGQAFVSTMGRLGE